MGSRRGPRVIIATPTTRAAAYRETKEVAVVPFAGRVIDVV
jgi:hypothetical protein